ncbi:MAG: hypothetical protein FWF55_04935 [Treponema sp.]|nr:hypothetical protein [Treponema sp.]
MNKNIFLGTLAFVLMSGMILAGCTTIDSVQGSINDPRESFQTILVPSKDFTSLGLVFTEATYEIDSSGERGEVLTYYALLKEAKALGADYIVNVVIDYKKEGSQQFFQGKPFGRLTKGKVTWYGAATAIKYSTTLKSTTSQVSADGKVITTTENTVMASSGNSGGSVIGGGGGGNSFSLFGMFKK